MDVANWMKQDVVTIRPKDNLLKAERLMTAYQIRHLPVLDEKETLCGILSDRDIRDHAPPPAKGKTVPARQLLLESVLVEKVMTREVFTIASDAPMERAVRQMKTRRIDSLPVLEGEKVVGIITSSNLLAYFNDILGIEAGSVKIELELKIDSTDSMRMAEAAIGMGLPVSGLIGKVDREAGSVRFSFFLHKSRLAEVEQAFGDAKIHVVRVMPVSE